MPPQRRPRTQAARAAAAFTGHALTTMSYSRPPESDPALRRDARIVYVVDDELVRGSLAGLLRSIDLEVRAYGSIEEFVAAPRRPCLPGA